MADDVNITVRVTNNARPGVASVNATMDRFTRDAQGRLRDLRGRFVAESSAMTDAIGQVAQAFSGGGGGGGAAAGGVGLNPAMLGVAAAGSTLLPAIGALSPMLFGMAATGGAAALAMGKIKEEAKKLKPQFEALQETAEKAVMPGVTKGFKDLQDAMKDLHPVIEVGGKAFGDFVAKAGAFAKSPAFQDALLKNVKLGSEWFGEFGDSIFKFTQSFLDFGAKSKPTLDALGGGINSILAVGLPDMFAGLEKGVGGSAAVFEGLFEAVNKTLGSLGRLSGSMANTFGPALGAIFRRVGELVESVEILLTPALDALTPTFHSLAQAMGASDGATKGLAEVLGKVLAGAARIAAVPLKNIFDFMAITLPLAKDLAAAIGGPLISAFLGITGAKDSVDSMSTSLDGWSNWVKNNKETIVRAFREISLVIMEIVMYAVEHIPDIYDAWAGMVRSSLAVLDVMVQGAAVALGWLPGIGESIKDAASNFTQFRGTVDTALRVAGSKIQEFSDRAGPRLRENYLRMNIDNWTAQIADAKRLLSDKNLPPEKRARLLANKKDLEAKIAAARRELASFDGRTATAYITTVHRRLDENMSKPLWKATGGVIGAAGGGPRSRMTLVGEQGPELVNLAPGSTVRSNPDTRRMLGGWAGAGPSQPIELVINLDGREVARQLWDPMRAEVWSRAGGDVQKALGRTR